MPLTVPPPLPEIFRLIDLTVELLAERAYLYEALAHAQANGGEVVQVWSDLEEEQQLPYLIEARRDFAELDFED